MTMNRDQNPAVRLTMPPMLLLLALMTFAAVHVQAASPRVIITPAAGFTITWNGNNGGFNNPASGAGPSNNIALAGNGTTAFGSTEFGAGVHTIAHANDGLYGNSHSWIANFTIPDPNPFLGLRFASSVNVSSIAWGRDNGDTVGDACGGTCMDRYVGIYTLQFTTVAAPDGSTADTGDAATGWANLGTIQYLAGAEDVNFTGYLRHRFGIARMGSPVAATGIRFKVSDPNICIDEIEVNPIADPVPPIADFIEITPAAGFGISWNGNEGNFGTTATPAPVPVNDASISRGATTFGSTELGPALSLSFHRFTNVNDGLYGNAHSWIPNFIGGDPAPYVGIRFGNRRLVSSVAWGRDNGDSGEGTFTDRALGVYVLQITAVTNPGVATPDACGPNPGSGWVTVGTLNFKANSVTYFNSHLRHRFDVTQGGTPIVATGLRIKVPNANSDIDEIEVNSNLAIENRAVRITNAPGLTITWDGNDGGFSAAAPPSNRALATAGTTPFTSSDLGPVLGIPFHRAVNLNDGLYGNANSWISANGVGGSSDPDPYAGLNFGGSVAITNIAWSRDNTPAPPYLDRTLDTYRLQFTTVAAPDGSTPDTGDAATGWQDVGTVTYASAAPPFFTPYVRHRFDIAQAGAPVNATGIRIKVANGNTDIDEIEINTSATPSAPPPAVAVTPAAGYSIAWDGNDGHFNNPAVGAAPPANRALASQGTTPFTSSDLGPALSIPFHRAVNLNDGLYGNANSWIPDFIGGDANPFAGLNFGAEITVTNIAWSRDNGDAVDNCCGGTATDRVLGLYTLQITTTASPGAGTAETGDASTGWETVGTIEYRRAEAPDFNPHLRHRFEMSAGGSGISATGLRIKVPNSSIDLDEIEVNTAAAAPRPQLTIAKSGANAVITWTYGGGLECATSITGPWTCVGDALSSGYTVPLNASPARFYRVRR